MCLANAKVSGPGHSRSVAYLPNGCQQQQQPHSIFVPFSSHSYFVRFDSTDRLTTLVVFQEFNRHSINRQKKAFMKIDRPLAFKFERGVGYSGAHLANVGSKKYPIKLMRAYRQEEGLKKNAEVRFADGRGH